MTTATAHVGDCHTRCLDSSCPCGNRCTCHNHRKFAEHLVSLVSSRAEPSGTDPDGEAGPLTPRAPLPESIEAGRRYAHVQLRRDGWQPAHVDALVDAIVDLEAERLTARIEAMKAYREVYAAAGEVGLHVWERARAASADVTALLQDLIDDAEVRVAAAIDAGLAGRR